MLKKDVYRCKSTSLYDDNNLNKHYRDEAGIDLHRFIFMDDHISRVKANT